MTSPRRILQLAYYPVFVASGLAAALFCVARTPEKLLPLTVFSVSITWIGIAALSERLLPFRAEWNRNLGDLRTDIFQTLVWLPLVGRLIEECLRAAGYQAPDLWPTRLPWLAQLAIALLISEFMAYWSHRLTHEVETLWRLHAVHHGAQRIYWANSGRFHPLDSAIQFTAYLSPLVFLGVPSQVMSLVLITNAITGVLEHSNINFRAGILNRVFNTAELHRWHHSSRLEISKKNFGKVLSVWDTVFGTYYRPEGATVSEIGFTDMPAVPTSLRGQLAYPFRQDLTNQVTSTP